jgi:glycine cleavage system regulatory protein
MSTSLVLTVIGIDRPGLIQAVAATVAQCGGNWLESRMCRLGGQFAGIVHVSVSEEAHPNLVENLGLLQEEGLTITVFADVNDFESPTGLSARLEIIGNDQPGIIRQITEILNEHQVNVEELQSEVLSAPMAGGLIFQAKTKIRLPASCHVHDLRKKLEALAADLQVDISFEED